MSNYKNIKLILRKQIEKGVKTLWTFDEETNNFTSIYKSYNNGLTIYTPLQLLEYLIEKEK
mgnify:FL=1|jgi:hypothetical protein|tara:strand:+ start:720 stop:902 length:183 start_codon:yes stop_codon:yes gene_type:complete